MVLSFYLGFVKAECWF